MPRKRFPPDDPREWIERARTNLRLAKTEPLDIDLEELCFNAQQAAEKAIKAVLIVRGIVFPYVHDLARLRSLLDRAGEIVPLTPKDAVDLTTFAGRTRYPSDDEPVTAPEYGRAVAIAETVVAWADERVRQERARADG